MDIDFKYKVVKNRLAETDDKHFRGLTVQNDCCLVNIVYMGDYVNDLKNNQLDTLNIIVSISKIFKNVIPFKCVNGFFMLDTELYPLLSYCPYENIDRAIETLKKSKENLGEFIKVFKEYFPGCYKTELKGN